MDDQTWISKLDSFKNSAMKKFSNESKEEFDKFVLQAHIFGKPEILEQILTSKKKKNRYFEVLDQCYVKLSTDESSLSAVERGFILKIGNQKDFLNLMETEAKKYRIDIYNPSFPGFHMRAMTKLKDLYDNSDRKVFEQTAKEILRYRNNSFCFKIDLINVLRDDPKYAYFWAKYCNLKHTVPQFIRNFDDICKADAAKLIKLMNKSLIFDTVYENLIISDPNALEKFIRTCFIKTQPKLLGIRVKISPKNGKVIFIQLATKNWIRVIDVYTLFTIGNLREYEMKQFIAYIYDPAIDRIGFNFEGDYNIIVNEFFEGQAFNAMKAQKRKGLCLKKLIQNIVKNPEAKDPIFWIQKLNEINLPNVAKTLLEIELDEENSLDLLKNWSSRPLSEQHKILILKDTVVLLLLKEKIENDIKWTFGESAALKMIEEGHVQIGINLCQYIQCTKCRLTKCVMHLLPSSLYKFLYQIEMAFNDGRTNVNWDQFRNDAINFQQNCGKSIYLRKAHDSAILSFLFEDFLVIPLRQKIALKSGSSEQIFASLFNNSEIVNEIMNGHRDGINFIYCLNCSFFYLSRNQMPENDEVEPEIRHKNTKKAKNVRRIIFSILKEIFPHQ